MAVEGVVRHVPTQRVRKDGSIVDVELELSRFVDAQGRTSGICGVIRDVTKAKTAEESLRRLEKAVDTTQIGVTITDMEGTIVYTNPAER